MNRVTARNTLATHFSDSHRKAEHDAQPTIALACVYADWMEEQGLGENAATRAALSAAVMARGLERIAGAIEGVAVLSQSSGADVAGALGQLRRDLNRGLSGICPESSAGTSEALPATERAGRPRAHSRPPQRHAPAAVLRALTGGAA